MFRWCFLLTRWISTCCLAEQEEERNSVAVPSCFTYSEAFCASEAEKDAPASVVRNRWKRLCCNPKGRHGVTGDCGGVGGMAYPWLGS